MDTTTYNAARDMSINALLDCFVASHVAGVIEDDDSVEIIIDKERKYLFYIHPQPEETDIRCVEHIRGWYDRSGWGEPTLHGVFKVTIPNEGAVEVNELNLSYVGKEECLPWLRALDNKWSGVITRKVADEIATLQTIWAET